MKLITKKQVFIRHNHYPHKTQRQDIERVKWAMRILENMFDRKSSHSPALIEKGYHYIPHPLYRPISTSIKKGAYFLFFGKLSRYKNLENLVKYWPSVMPLRICGYCDEPEFVHELQSLIQDKEIVVQARYHERQELEEIIENSSAVILPHQSEDMITSGSFFYAVSFCKPIIALENKFYRSIMPDFKKRGLYMLNSISEVQSLNFNNLEPIDPQHNNFIQGLKANWLGELAVETKQGQAN
ncbi:MAG: glycosyltransferase [Sphingomonadales bacterium]|nr:glycosyltransferase [Sphingomonadales bacterium]